MCPNHRKGAFIEIKVRGQWDMRKELPHFEVGQAYGGSQDWFHSPMMRLGGCAAATVCDCAIYFDRNYGTLISLR